MKEIKIFVNAKVVSVNNGEIRIEVDSKLHTYHDAALVSVNDGIVKIEINNPLTEDILKNGRVVEYRNGNRRLVLKRPDGHAILVSEDAWASEPLLLTNDYEIVKVYEATFEGDLRMMVADAYKLVWSK